MEDMIKSLGNMKFLVKTYDIDEIGYTESEITYFELATFILTQEFVKIEIRRLVK